jgi:hypothetical protein
MAVLAWLLDSDPAIRWQVLRDLADAPAERVAAERSRVAHEGWGARLLAARGEDGLWEGGACFPGRDFGQPEDRHAQPWTSTLPVLELLYLFGVDPGDAGVRQAVADIEARCRWEHAGQPFFEGEVEPCINGRTVALDVYFGRDASRIVERLLGEQLEDGGWNCEAERAPCALRSTPLSTCWRACWRTNGPPVAQRRLSQRADVAMSISSNASCCGGRAPGEVVKPSYLQFSFPTRWHYDVLRGLEYFRAAGDPPDPRMGEAIELVRSKQQADGTWLLENGHPGRVHFTLEDGDGRPSRWNTLRALRVLRWSSATG